MMSTYYMLVTKQGNPLVISCQLPIFFYKKVAIEESKKFKCGIKAIQIDLNPKQYVMRKRKRVLYKVDTKALKMDVKNITKRKQPNP